MNWENKEKRAKKVFIELEYMDKTDLKAILSDLTNLIGSGIEMYSGDRQNAENNAIYSKFEFTQSYVEQVHKTNESEINGELRLVIKSKL